MCPQAMPEPEKRDPNYSASALTFSDEVFSALADLVKAIARYQAVIDKKATIDQVDMQKALPKAMAEFKAKVSDLHPQSDADAIKILHELIRKYASSATP